MAMIHKADISSLIQHAILSMCRETYDLEAEVEIDGLICLHDCKTQEYNIVRLHEIFKSGEKSLGVEYGMSVDPGNANSVHQQEGAGGEPFSPSRHVHLSSQNSGHNGISYVDLSQSVNKSIDGSYGYTAAGYNIYDAEKNYIVSQAESSLNKDSVECQIGSEKGLNQGRIKKARMDSSDNSDNTLSKNRGNKFSASLDTVVIKTELKSSTGDEDITDGSTKSENVFEEKNNLSPSHGESIIRASTYNQTDMIKCMQEMRRKALAGNSHQANIQGNEIFKGITIKVEPPDESETLSLQDDKLPFSHEEPLQTLEKQDAFQSDLFHEQDISRLPFENCETENNLLDEYSRHYESDDSRNYEVSKSKPDVSPDFVNSVSSATISPVTGNYSFVHNRRSFSNNSVFHLKGRFSDQSSSALSQQEYSGELLFKETDPKKQDSTLIPPTDDLADEDSHGLFMIKPGWLASEIRYRTEPVRRSSRPVIDTSDHSHCSTAEKLSQAVVLVSDREPDDGDQFHDSFERQLLARQSPNSDESQRLSDKVHVSKGSYAQEQQIFTSPKVFQKVGKLVSPGTSQSRGKGVFFCSKCGARFTFRQSRDRHEKSSCGVPLISPYPCEICGKLFKRKDYLKTHREKFHPVSKRTDNDISSMKISSSF